MAPLLVWLDSWRLAHHNSAFVKKDIGVVEASEACDVFKIVIGAHDMSSSLDSQVVGKAFVFERIAYPMRSTPTPLGRRL